MGTACFVNFGPWALCGTCSAFAIFAVSFASFAVKDFDCKDRKGSPEGWAGRLVPPYTNAMTSISTKTSFGKRATSTVERAGGATLKKRP